MTNRSLADGRNSIHFSCIVYWDKIMKLQGMLNNDYRYDITANGSLPAGCRGGVGFESDPHRFTLDMLNIATTAAMSGT